MAKADAPVEGWGGGVEGGVGGGEGGGWQSAIGVEWGGRGGVLNQRERKCSLYKASVSVQWVQHHFEIDVSGIA